ncbi:dermonecrotic toxin domain-containing protein [Pseudomonas sp.]|jgi:hypothetical protein|uniref:dermonecrotic toxin domain-containing protein n=1 Tax=Pseudomonas sp. TaxID=306 RepID=UPI002E3158D7|nr:DUF6543 domain-containing protein [Pseudomonas sp.]HEX4548484.1 DUF6543 domain-containing protein [Pseudomonas sp.]
MYYEIHSASRTALSATRDTYAKSALLQALDEIDLQRAERLAIKPNFHEFAQQAFETHFPSLKPFPDLLRCFISFDGQTVPLGPIESVESPEPDVRSDEPENSAADIDVVPPSLMDAVVRRIVSAEAADYSARKARFHRAADSAEIVQAYNALTPQAFDGFLDQMASNLESQYTQYLERYWAQVTGPTDQRTRQQWLVATHIEQLQAEAALLAHDGLLDAGAVSLLKTVQRYPTAQSRQAFRTYHPCAYGIAFRDSEASAITLHGAFILTARDPQDAEVRWESEVTTPVARPVTPTANVGNVLLFTLNNGLEAFDSLAALDRELHRRLSHAVEFSTFSALVADKDQLRVLALHRAAPLRDRVEYLERVDSPFNHCIESLGQLIKENFASTRDRFVKQGVHAQMADFPAAVDRACDPLRHFGFQTVLSARLRKQCKARIGAFLHDASAQDCQAWATAFQACRDAIAELADPEGLPSPEQFSDRRQLMAYSNRQLRVALEAQYGLTVNPDEILVTTRKPLLPPGIRPAGASGSSVSEPGVVRYSHKKRSLTELALENIGGIDPGFVLNTTLMLQPAVGEAVEYTDLTLEQIKDLVRELDIGQTYQDFLQKSLITSAPALDRKQSYIRLVERQMRLSAIEAKINGDFASDRLERGFNWVQAVLDAPQDNDQRRAVEGHRVIVQYLQLRAQRVRGVLLFTTSGDATGSIVVYTPDAPGAKVFHEFSKDRFIADFVHNSTWRDYLVARVSPTYQAHVRATLKGRGDVSTVNRTRIAKNLFEDLYESEVNFTINAVAKQVTTTHQTNVETGLSVATTLADVLTMILPVHVTLPVGIARCLISIFNAVEAIRIDDRAGAAHHIVRALVELTGVLIDGVMATKLVAPGQTSFKVVPGARALDPQMALRKKPEGLLELESWAGQGIYYKRSANDSANLYFLNDRERWFSIIDEGFEEAWRVRDARKPVQKHYSPIRRNAQGQWEIGTHPDAPALGGMTPQSALRNAYPALDQAQADHVFRSFSFPRGREIELGLHFVHRYRHGLTLDEFVPYLLVSLDTLRMRVRGINTPAFFSGGGVVQPSTSTRATVLPVSTRPAHERFLDWGQRIAASDLKLQDARLGIYARTRGSSRQVGSLYIKIDEHYYPILPPNELSTLVLAHLYDDRLDLRSYALFEDLLHRDLYSQPRAAFFSTADNRWILSAQLPFEKNLAGYVSDAFPTFSPGSCGQVAKALFEHSFPNGLADKGMSILVGTLKIWRRAVRSTPYTATDPLLLLSVTPKSAAGRWLLQDIPGTYNRLQFSSNGAESLLQSVRRNPTNSALRALMRDRLTGSGYEMIAGDVRAPGLLFRHPESPTLYWISLRSVFGDEIDGSHFTFPRIDLMDPAVRQRVTQAQSQGQFVPLVGGVHLTDTSAPGEIFVIRV